MENDNVTRAVPAGPPVAGPPGVAVAVGVALGGGFDTGPTLGGVVFPPEQLPSNAAKARTMGAAAEALMLPS